MGKKEKKQSDSSQKEAFDPLPIESKTAATAVLMLKSPEEEILAKACEAIHKFAEKDNENKTSLACLGAVQPLSHLISHKDKAVRRNAVMALAVMTPNREVKKSLRKLDVVPEIISKLSPQEEVAVHEFATLCLISLSEEFSYKVQIFEHDGLGCLIQLLSSPDPDVKKNSVECISNLVQDFQNRVAVQQLNGIPPLLDLLRSEFPVIQRLALSTIEKITTDSETRAAFRNSQGLQRILDVLATKEFGDLHETALRVISNCLEDSESMLLLQQIGLEQLVMFVSTPRNPEEQAKAVKVIAKMAQSDDNRKLLHEKNIEKALADLLVLDNDARLIAACQAVTTTSEHLPSKEAFSSLDVIRPVLQLLNSDQSILRTAAAEALASLTVNHRLNANGVHDAEGEALLVQQLEDSCAEAAVQAASVLTNMAEHEELREHILAHKALPALVGMLKSPNNLTVISAAQAVASLACDAEAREELRNIGGLTPLVQLLKSVNADVRRSICWAVCVCASDDKTIVELCNAGACDTLQEMHLSCSRKSKFSELALRKLLDNNLSLKYSLTGHLSFTDITTDGFYDHGQIKMDYKFPTLEDISKQTVDSHRATIAINAKPLEEVIVKEPEPPKQVSPPSRPASATSTKKSSKSKTKGKVQKEEEKKKEEPEVKPLEVLEYTFRLPSDPSLYNLVKKAAKSISLLQDDVKMYTALASLVCEAMGGQIEPENMEGFQWELHISELKTASKSNIVLIGNIKAGTYFHRALLFKILADRIGLSCSLVRGEYNRAWNEVLVCSDYAKPESYVIDLIHKPGHLMESSSTAATEYQTI